MAVFEYFTLPNGIRLVHRYISTTKIFHCGFVLDIGSRDELSDQLGLAHFWEHMAFKGTRKRKAFHILNRLDSLGGELNAYTTKEKIYFYASVLDRFYDKAFDLLTDITFDSVFPSNQIEKERKVILEEMAMYYDSPEDAIYDEFDQVIFNGHPLGNNILGSAESVRSFDRLDFKKFISENLDTERIIFSSVGNVTFGKVKKMAQKLLEPIPGIANTSKRAPFDSYRPQNKTIARHITQSHCVLGRTAYSIHSKKRIPFILLVNLLGGPGMNSRLNLALREKYGYVYSVDASYSSFTDTGLFGIYFSTEPGQSDKSIDVVMKEFKKIKSRPLGVLQLHRAKEQLMGQLAIAEENNIALMLMMGKSLLDLNKIDSLTQIFKKIKNISASNIQEAAVEIFQEDLLSLLKFVPNDYGTK